MCMYIYIYVVLLVLINCLLVTIYIIIFICFFFTLVRPTLDVLQKARSNIENHLKEINTNNIPPGSAQSRRRHRSNRQE